MCIYCDEKMSICCNCIYSHDAFLWLKRDFHLVLMHMYLFL